LGLAQHILTQTGQGEKEDKRKKNQNKQQQTPPSQLHIKQIKNQLSDCF